MAEEDVPNAITVLHGPVAASRRLADRLQQGFLDFLFIGRALIHPDGFAADPAFQRDGRPLIDTRRLFYYGNSQGGIAGGALTARGAGLQPLGALRRRDELQPAAHAQRRLRRLRARCSTRPIPTSSSAR